MVSSRSRTISKKRRRTSFGANKRGVYASAAPAYFAVPTGEMKFVDTTFASAATTTAGAITNSSLNVIPQDNTESGRIGRKCVIKRVQLQGKLQLPASSTLNTSSDIVRIIVYQDKQTNGAAATVALLLEAANIFSFRNLENSGRFNILMDKKMTINAQGATGTSSSAATKPWSLYKSCNIPIEFDASASTGVITTMRSNNVGVMVISDDGRAQIEYRARVRFSDQ